MLGLGTLLRSRYRIDRMLEISASGGLYRAWDTQENVAVVVRELLPQPDLSPQAMTALQQQFEREAEALLHLSHPHLVQVLDFFLEHIAEAELGVVGAVAYPSAYLVTAYVEGERLADRIHREGLPQEDKVVTWAGQILGALEHCHHNAVIHQDVRPENILIRLDGKAMLTNFGLAGLWQPTDPRRWTATQVLGTPEYASPEQWQQQVSQIDARSDIYGLGATLYYALSGSPPPAAAERTANPYRFLPLKGLSSRFSGDLHKVVLRAMALPRDKRYPDAHAMVAALHSPGVDIHGEAKPAPLILERRRATYPIARVLGLLFSTAVIFLAGFVVTYFRPAAPVLTPTVSPSTPAPTQLIALETRAPGTPEAPAPPTATRTPRPTPTPTLEPQLDLAVTRVLSWTVVVDDGFDSNANAWLDSTGQDDWGTIVRSIDNGQYTWQIEALQGVGRWCTPNMPTLGDFYASVDAQRQSGALNTAYGLMLRYQDGSYHVFSVRDDGYYRFGTWYGSEWQTQIDWTATLVVTPGEVNQLAVIGDDDRFELYLNGSYLDAATSNLLETGEVGLSVDVVEPGSAVVIFDNFLVRSPETTEAEPTPAAPEAGTSEAEPEG